MTRYIIVLVFGVHNLQEKYQIKSIYVRVYQGLQFQLTYIYMFLIKVNKVVWLVS